MRGSHFGQQRPVKRRRRGAEAAGLERLEGRQLLATFTVVNANDSGTGSLRNAITAANLSGGADTINFTIGSGRATIKLITPLPPLADTVTVDGTSQPGYAGRPLVDLDGTLIDRALFPNGNGLRVSASGSTVKGLVINNMPADGILIDSDSNTITNNFLGTSQDGLTAQPNGSNGLEVLSGSNNRIGTSGLTNGNLISGNTLSGVQIDNASATFNRIQNNLIGTDLSGANPLGNGGTGVLIMGGVNTQIGGLTSDLANTISGNKGGGIWLETPAGNGVANGNTAVRGNFIGTDLQGVKAVPNIGAGVLITNSFGNVIGGNSAAATRNVISGNTGPGISINLTGTSTLRSSTITNNLIGTAADGMTALGNGAQGILINGSNVLVGGTGANEPNTIAFNGQVTPEAGVVVATGTNNTITGNSIFGNTRLGIDLNDDGPTMNDGFDGDTGPNNLQNFPVLSTSSNAQGFTLIQGRINSTPNSTLVLQFFSSDAADPTGYGQGRTYISTGPNPYTVTTDDQGNARFNLTLRDAPVQPGEYITATATAVDPLSGVLTDTSEFSPAVKVDPGTIADLGVTISASPSPAALNNPYTYTITVTNNSQSTAKNVTLDDVLPSGLTNASATVSQGTFTLGTTNGITFHADLGDIDGGGTATATITVTPTQLGTVSTTATVASDQIDTDSSNNTAVLPVQVSQPADLSVTATTQPPKQVVENGTLTYMFVVTNNGPGTATSATLAITLPPGATYINASPGQGTASGPIGGVVNVSLLNIDSGRSVAVGLVVLAPPITNNSATQPAVLTARVSADQSDPTPENNVFTGSIDIKPAADLQVALDASPSPVLAGQDLTYTATVRNTGPSTAYNVVVTDTLPPGVDVLSITSSAPGATFVNLNGVITANLGDLGSDTSATLTVVVAPHAPGTITSTVNARSVDPTDPTVEASIDPDNSNNTATVDVAVSPADLGVSMIATPSPAVIGQPLTYTLAIHNAGPADATNVVLRDTLPQGVQYLSASADVPDAQPVVGDGVLAMVLGDLVAGATVTVRVTVMPTSSTLLTNTATVTADQNDVNPSDNTATLSTGVSPADLAVTVTPSAASPIVGEPLTYTVTVTNNGPFAASNATVSDQLPAGTNFLGASVSQGSYTGAFGVLTAQLGTLAPGATATLTIVISPTDTGTLTSQVAATSDQYDPVSLNNAATSTVQAINLPGTFNFSATGYAVDEGSGTATITVTRTSGTLGTVSVNYVAYPGSAQDGVDFTQVGGTLVFGPGQSSATFQVPIIDNSLTQPTRTVNLILGMPTGGAGIGPIGTSTILIRDNDPDLKGPTIGGVTPQGNNSVTSIVLQFNEALDPARASNPANYAILVPGYRVRGRTFAPQALPLTVAYNPANNTVTLTPTQPLPLNVFSTILVNGSGPGGLTDLSGNALAGDGTGVNGRDLTLNVGIGKQLTWLDRTADQVTLSLTGPGLIEVVRGPDGEAISTTVLGTDAARSTISGRFVPARLGSDGQTSLGIVTGLVPPFARVRSTLRTPPFISQSQVAVITGGGSSSTTAPTAIVRSTPAGIRALAAARRQARLAARRVHG